MRVPEYQSQVALVVPEAPGAPRLQNIEMPKPDNSVPEALSKVAETVGQHVLERQQHEQASKAAQLDTDFRVNLQNKIYNEEVEKINVGGNTVERPAGLLNRQMSDAEGVTQEFDAYHNELKQRYVAAAPTAELGLKLGQEMDGQYVSARGLIIKHEAKQKQKILLNAQVSNLKQQTHDAALINDPVTLFKAINKAKDTQANIHDILGSDPDTVAMKQKDSAGDIVAQATKSLLMSTGDFEKAQKMLDVAKDEIQPDRYDTILKSLVTSADRIKRDNDLIASEKRISNEVNYLTNFASGQLVNIDNVMKDAREGNVNERMAVALQNVISTKGRYRPQENSNANYPEFIRSIYRAKDQEELHQSLINLLQNHSNMSVDKMSILINGAMQRSGNLPLSRKNGDHKPITPEQQAIDSGAMSVLEFGKNSYLSNFETSGLYGDYMSAVKSGKKPKEAMDATINGYRLQKNPKFMNLSEKGQLMIDARGNKAMVFPDGRVEELQKDSPTAFDNFSKSKKENK